MGKTPIEYSLSSNAEISNTFFKLPEKCLLFNVFNTKCAIDNFEELMSPWELAVVQLVHILNEDESGHNIPTNIIPSIYRNSPYLTTAILSVLNYTGSDLRRCLLSTMRRKLPPNNLFQYSLVALAGLRPDVLLVCNQPFEMSPLHNLAYYKDSFFVDDVQMDTIMNLVFKWRPFHRCPDSKGFSILNYCIIGGKKYVSEVFRQYYGDHVTNKEVRYTDILWLTLFPLTYKCSWNRRYKKDFVLSEFISLHF